MGTQHLGSDELPDASHLPKLEVIPPVRPRTPSGSTVLDEGAIEEHGRTFQHYKADSYILPNDAYEQTRLDLQHHIQKLLLGGKLYQAPIEKPQNVLDLGAGTGIWAIEFAKQNPESNVIGSDLSRIQPPNIVPNVSFIREDAEDEWTHTQKFDYIHARAFCGFPTNIRAVLKKAYDHLQPGGWIELHEFAHEIEANNPTMPIDHSAIMTIIRAYTAVAVKNGSDPWVVPHLGEILKQIGFIDIVQEDHDVPLGGWPATEPKKTIGKWHGRNIEMALGDGKEPSVFIKPLLQSGMSEGQVAHLTAEGIKEMKGESAPRVFAQQKYFVLYGRRPLSG